MSRLLARLLVVALTLIVARPCAAAQEPGSKPAYESAIEAGLTEYAAGNFEEARLLFLRAHALDPTARTLRGLGMAEYELRNYPRAVEFLQQALVSRRKPLDGELRTRTGELLARASAFVSSVTLQLEPPTATIEIDGVLLEDTNEPTLSVGEHVLTVRAPGRKTETRTLHVRGGEPQSLRIMLLPVVTLDAASASANAPAPHERDERSSRTRRRWLWATAALVVAAGVAVGVGLTLRPEARTRSDAGDLGMIFTTLQSAP